MSFKKIDPKKPKKRAKQNLQQKTNRKKLQMKNQSKLMK